MLYIVLFLAPFLGGCASTQPCLPITTTEYVEVKVPVVYKLKRPDRPKFNPVEPTPVYLSNVLIYTEILENIIDGTRK
jgi:hypothetical protein